MTREEIDCISREQAKASIRDKFKDLPSRVEINTILNELPSVTLQESKWIPVSERLPEDKQRCLVTAKNLIATRNICEIATYSTDLYKVDKYDFADKRNVPGFYSFDGEYGYFEWTDVVAWMPLPKPYKAEMESEE